MACLLNALVLACIISTLVSSVLAQILEINNYSVAFQYPTDNLTFNYQDYVIVSYTSTLSTAALFLFCTNTSNSDDTITENISTVVAPNGTALAYLSYANGSPCWFDLRPAPDSLYTLGANSPKFNLNLERAFGLTYGLDSSTITFATSTSAALSSLSSSTTPGSSSSTTSPALASSVFISSLPTSTFSTAVSTSTAETTLTGSSSSEPPIVNISTSSTSGLSIMAKAGIASAFVTGVTLATVVTFSLWLRAQDSKSKSNDQATNLDTTSRASVLPSSVSMVIELPAKADPAEMPA